MAADWERLLCLRARELAPGGVLLCVLPMYDEVRRLSLFAQVTALNHRLVEEWVRDGTVAAAQAQAMAFGVYMRSQTEVTAPFRPRAPDGAAVAPEALQPFEGLTVQHFEVQVLQSVHWQADAAAFAKAEVASLLAVVRPMWERALAGSPRCHELIGRLVEKLEEGIAMEPEQYRYDYVVGTLLLRKDG